MRASLSLLLATSLTLPSQDGEQVIRDAWAKYEGTWYGSLTFVQRTSFADGRLETWYESLQAPGMLRIDYAPASNGRAVIIRNDSLYPYNGGTLGTPRPLVHSLLVLLYDIHTQPPDVSIRRLRALGFDLSKTNRTTWQGREVIVVGATAGDTTSRQAWFDAERFVVVRVIQPGPQGTQDTQVGAYAAVGRWWHEREVVFRVNGVVTLREEYTDVKVGAPLPASVFDPVAAYAKPVWIGEGLPRW